MTHASIPLRSTHTTAIQTRRYKGRKTPTAPERNCRLKLFLHCITWILHYGDPLHNPKEIASMVDM
ncbi:hypothetical protein Goari_008625 [Gossypium aridum]|uniref:Uncharacterized protein n=1 Tax=Gossypium aridum TaxID=34290 RepID=A0A7J8XUH6_GOSAI|nr:hypothetical protein [Gossypium aridum]